ncbi:RNA-directed DNA polymerase, eukaryota, reverse transcriptase zinc-binding domain protein, partial [Tanacetum coccineum]
MGLMMKLGFLIMDYNERTDSNEPNKVKPTPMQVNVQPGAVKTCVGVDDSNKSYADKVSNRVFSEGSKKWELTACGYFVGYKMSIQEIRYQLYRMWSKLGIRHILNNGNRVFVFKFDNQQGLQTVIESGPWILMNQPLEAWSVKGLSALASRIGKPLTIDAMTTRMCKQGIGRLGYARVLVEVDAKKGLEDHIDVLYRSSSNGEQFVKKVNVEYDWKPPICKKCMVFRHSDNNCNRKDKTNEQVLEQQNRNQWKRNLKLQSLYTERRQRKVIRKWQKKRTANKFAILQDMEEEDGFAKLSMKEKEEVDKSFYCTFIYAANKGKDRRELWKELSLNKRIVGSSAWIIIGDVNVSLNLEDHSEGMSQFAQDMIEFQECINEIEMEDINCFGFHFTWTKSLLNTNATVLKKIDRIIGNRHFSCFNTKPNAQIIWKPNPTQDLSP